MIRTMRLDDSERMIVDFEVVALAALVELEGRCRRDNPENIDPELFHPIGKTDSNLYLDQVDAAKVICVDCPVRQECFDLARYYDNVLARRPNGSIIKARVVTGVWGGTTKEERLDLYKTKERQSA